MNNLNQLRQQINLIDSQIDDLLNQRFNISQAVALHKNKYHQKIYDDTREQQLLDQLAMQSHLTFSEGHIYLKQQLMFASRQYQYQFIQIPNTIMNKHHIKKLGYHRDIHPNIITPSISYDTNEQLIEALIHHKIDTAMICASLNDMSIIQQLHIHHLYITGYSDNAHQHILQISNKLYTPDTTHMLGIIITMRHQHALSPIIDLFNFYQINIEQLFLLSDKQLFVRFLGNYHHQTIQKLLYILKSEQDKISIRLIY